jgi:hypothetical protein
MSVTLPPLPIRVQRLKKDKRGYPVPWFVQWFEDGKPSARGIGEPDFRVVWPGAVVTAYKHERCWICGEPLGVHKVAVIGPMCAITRTTSEPPSHRACAEFAAKACPFLTNPREKRSAKNLPVDASVPGTHLDRNPGAVCLWETRQIKPFAVGNGSLFRLGDPVQVDWYAQGRKATRAEIEESIKGGYPLLLAEARKDGADGVRELEQAAVVAMRLLPAA